jgi:4-amino-4-deoxy-L-arabinose transferase-like glycosyltransferase
MAVLASLAVGLALTWQRWGNPLIDCGREMNQPLRLLHGERLYGDVSHFYGPLAPLLNAMLYRVFGISLDTLRAAGLIATLVILATTYWLARRLMGRVGATLAALSVTWLCALSSAGNYILPYAYAAVYGTALSLLALTAAVGALRSGSLVRLVGVGALAGLALLAKTEMGLAAVAGGLTAALLAGAPERHRAVLRCAAVLLPALGLPMATYVHYAARVGWTPLLDEGHLLYQHLAAPILVFNQGMFGLDRPGHSVLLVAAAAVRLTFLAALLSWCAMRLHARQDARTARLRDLTAALTIAALGTLALAGAEGGPYLAVPLLLLALAAFHARRLWRRLRAHGQAHGRAAVVLVLSVFAWTSLARTVLRVRSGGSYSSYLLPAAVVLFTYVWCALLPASLPIARARRFVRMVSVLLLTCWVLGVALTTVARYRTRNTALLETPRGTMMTTPGLKRAFSEAMAFIETCSRPQDAVAVFPEGTALLFFTDRRNPLHEEITVPGFLYEDRAIATLAQQSVALVLVANRPTPEYGPARFGVDYARRLMKLIEDRFVPCGQLGGAEPGSLRFDAYCATGAASSSDVDDSTRP